MEIIYEVFETGLYWSSAGFFMAVGGFIGLSVVMVLSDFFKVKISTFRGKCEKSDCTKKRDLPTT